MPNLKSNGFIAFMLILQITVYFVVYANIPVARTVVCFLYLLLVPGIIILKLLALENLDITERVLFSVGLSVAFLMLIGLIINEIAKLVVASPLSINLLILSINTTILLMSFVGVRHGNLSLTHEPRLNRSEFVLLIVMPISLFLLGSCGITVVNTSGNSFLLLILILATAIIVSLVFLSEKSIPSTFYPFILFVVCICVVFFVSNGTAPITKYITGNGDQWFEYYSFKLTEIHRFWDSSLVSSPYSGGLFPYYSMISVTILPLIFSTFSGLDGSSVFKLLYPLIVSLIALATYKLYKTQIDSKSAFLATFFLVTVSVGLGWGSSKQEIAQPFYVLLFLLLFKKNISPSRRNILFIIFSAALVISHYALTYIFLFTILLAFLILALINYLRAGSIKDALIGQTNIPLTLVLLFLTITFSWYIFINSSATFSLFTKEISTVTSNLGQFFSLSSRGTALQGLGIAQTPDIFHRFGSALFIFTEFLILLGFLKLITSKDKNSRFSTEYKIIATLNMAIIATNIILPKIADTFLMSRFYQTTLIILAPLAVLGGRTIVELIPKPKFRKHYAALLVFVVFIPLFLFQTAFIYEVAKAQSSSLPLSMYRWTPLDLYGYTVNSQEVVGAQWIPKYANTTDIFLYSDHVSQSNVLTAYGMIESGRVYYLSNTTRPTLNELIYLADVNLVNKEGIFNATEISPILENQNKIYSNGQSEIYKGCTP